MESEWNVIPINKNTKIPSIKWLDYQNKKFKDWHIYEGKSLILKLLSFKSLIRHDTHIKIAKFLFNLSSLTSSICFIIRANYCNFFFLKQFCKFLRKFFNSFYHKTNFISPTIITPFFFILFFQFTHFRSLFRFSNIILILSCRISLRQSLQKK